MFDSIRLKESSKKKLLNIALFQAGWFICIFAGSLWAVGATLLALLIHGFFFVKHAREWIVIVLFSALGIAIDSTLINFDILKSTSSLIPLWLICLWVFLSFTLCHSLQWLQDRLALSAVAAAVLGPWSYWAGSQFVDIQLTSLPISFLVLSLVWALVLPLGLFLARKLLSKPISNTKSKKKSLSPLLMLGLISASMVSFLPYSQSANAKPIDAPAAGTSIVVGTAYDSEGEEILYKEIHTQTNALNRHVQYVSPQGNTIAKKNINYTNSLISPSYTLENYWANEKTYASWEESQLYLRFSHPPKANNESSDTDEQAQEPTNKEKNFSIESVVIDAGFDHYIRENWQALMTGEQLKYTFAVASRLTTLDMRIQSKPCESTLSDMNSSDILCLRTQPNGFLFRLLLTPIELSYHRSTQQLLRFRGLGNIADKNGDLLNVDIRYNYTGD
jgi:hypothetical protein